MTIEHKYFWKLKTDCQNFFYIIPNNLFRYFPLQEVQLNLAPFPLNHGLALLILTRWRVQKEKIITL